MGLIKTFSALSPWVEPTEVIMITYLGSLPEACLKRRIRLEAQDTSLSRRRPRVRIPYALPTTFVAHYS